MSRGMWILAALIAAFTIAMIYQESSGGIEQPWAQCKESLVQQMLSGDCTPRTGGMRAPGTAGPADAPAGAPAADPGDRPVGEIRRN